MSGTVIAFLRPCVILASEQALDQQKRVGIQGRDSHGKGREAGMYRE